MKTQKLYPLPTVRGWHHRPLRGNGIWAARLTMMVMACLFLSGAAQAWDISVTRTSADDPVVVCPGCETTITFSASITGDPPADTAECTVSGPTWQWSGDASGTSSSSAVTKTYTADTTITATVEATYTYTNKPGKTSKCPDPDKKTKQTQVSVKVAKVELSEATFGNGNHALKKDNGTYGSDGTGDVAVPQIKKNGTSYDQSEVCYTWEAKPSLAAKFAISPSISEPGCSAVLKLKGKVGTTTLIYASKDVTLKGSSVDATFTTDSKLAKKIDNSTIDLTWEIEFCGGTTQSLASTSNKIFVTAGTPAGSVNTLTRINRLTTDCKGLSSEPDIVDALWTKVAGPGSYQLGVTAPTPRWKILDGTPGECIHIAELFEKCIQLIGLTPGEGSVVFLYADPGKTSHESAATNNHSTRNCTVGNTGHTATIGETHDDVSATEVMPFQDKAGGWNNWEACYKYRHTATSPWTWYAAGTNGKKFASVQACMVAITAQTAWGYRMATTNGFCAAPGPYPELVW